RRCCIHSCIAWRKSSSLTTFPDGKSRTIPKHASAAPMEVGPSESVRPLLAVNDSVGMWSSVALFPFTVPVSLSFQRPLAAVSGFPFPAPAAHEMQAAEVDRVLTEAVVVLAEPAQEASHEFLLPRSEAVAWT